MKNTTSPSMKKPTASTAGSMDAFENTRRERVMAQLAEETGVRKARHDQLVATFNMHKDAYKAWDEECKERHRQDVLQFRQRRQEEKEHKRFEELRKNDLQEKKLQRETAETAANVDEFEFTLRRLGRDGSQDQPSVANTKIINRGNEAKTNEETIAVIRARKEDDIRARRERLQRQFRMETEQAKLSKDMAGRKEEETLLARARGLAATDRDEAVKRRLHIMYKKVLQSHQEEYEESNKRRIASEAALVDAKFSKTAAQDREVANEEFAAVRQTVKAKEDENQQTKHAVKEAHCRLFAEQLVDLALCVVDHNTERFGDGNEIYRADAPLTISQWRTMVDNHLSADAIEQRRVKNALALSPASKRKKFSFSMNASVSMSGTASPSAMSPAGTTSTHHPPAAAQSVMLPPPGETVTTNFNVSSTTAGGGVNTTTMETPVSEDSTVTTGAGTAKKVSGLDKVLTKEELAEQEEERRVRAMYDEVESFLSTTAQLDAKQVLGFFRAASDSTPSTTVAATQQQQVAETGSEGHRPPPVDTKDVEDEADTEQLMANSSADLAASLNNKGPTQKKKPVVHVVNVPAAPVSAVFVQGDDLSGVKLLEQAATANTSTGTGLASTAAATARIHGFEIVTPQTLRDELVAELEKEQKKKKESAAASAAAGNAQGGKGGKGAGKPAPKKGAQQQQPTDANSRVTTPSTEANDRPLSGLLAKRLAVHAQDLSLANLCATHDLLFKTPTVTSLSDQQAGSDSAGSSPSGKTPSVAATPLDTPRDSTAGALAADPNLDPKIKARQEKLESGKLGLPAACTVANEHNDPTHQPVATVSNQGKRLLLVGFPTAPNFLKEVTDTILEMEEKNDVKSAAVVGALGKDKQNSSGVPSKAATPSAATVPPLPSGGTTNTKPNTQELTINVELPPAPTDKGTTPRAGRNALRAKSVQQEEPTIEEVKVRLQFPTALVGLRGVMLTPDAVTHVHLLEEQLLDTVNHPTSVFHQLVNPFPPAAPAVAANGGGATAGQPPQAPIAAVKPIHWSKQMSHDELGALLQTRRAQKKQEWSLLNASLVGPVTELQQHQDQPVTLPPLTQPCIISMNDVVKAQQKSQKMCNILIDRLANTLDHEQSWDAAPVVEAALLPSAVFGDDVGNATTTSGAKRKLSQQVAAANGGVSHDSSLSGRNSTTGGPIPTMAAPDQPFAQTPRTAALPNAAQLANEPSSRAFFAQKIANMARALRENETRLSLHLRRCGDAAVQYFSKQYQELRADPTTSSSTAGGASQATLNDAATKQQRWKFCDTQRKKDIIVLGRIINKLTHTTTPCVAARVVTMAQILLECCQQLVQEAGLRLPASGTPVVAELPPSSGEVQPESAATGGIINLASVVTLPSLDVADQAILEALNSAADADSLERVYSSLLGDTVKKLRQTVLKEHHHQITIATEVDKRFESLCKRVVPWFLAHQLYLDSCRGLVSKSCNAWSYHLFHAHNNVTNNVHDIHRPQNLVQLFAIATSPAAAAATSVSSPTTASSGRQQPSGAAAEPFELHLNPQDVVLTPFQLQHICHHIQLTAADAMMRSNAQILKEKKKALQSQQGQQQQPASPDGATIPAMSVPLSLTHEEFIHSFLSAQVSSLNLYLFLDDDEEEGAEGSYEDLLENIPVEELVEDAGHGATMMSLGSVESNPNDASLSRLNSAGGKVKETKKFAVGATKSAEVQEQEEEEKAKKHQVMCGLFLPAWWTTPSGKSQPVATGSGASLLPLFRSEALSNTFKAFIEDSCPVPVVDHHHVPVIGAGPQLKPGTPAMQPPTTQQTTPQASVERRKTTTDDQQQQDGTSPASNLKNGDTPQQRAASTTTPPAEAVATSQTSSVLMNQKLEVVNFLCSLVCGRVRINSRPIGDTDAASDAVSSLKSIAAPSVTEVKSIAAAFGSLQSTPIRNENDWHNLPWWNFSSSSSGSNALLGTSMNGRSMTTTTKNATSMISQSTPSNQVMSKVGGPAAATPTTADTCPYTPDEIKNHLTIKNLWILYSWARKVVSTASSSSLTQTSSPSSTVTGSIHPSPGFSGVPLLDIVPMLCSDKTTLKTVEKSFAVMGILQAMEAKQRKGSLPSTNVAPPPAANPNSSSRPTMGGGPKPPATSINNGAEVARSVVSSNQASNAATVSRSSLLLLFPNMAPDDIDVLVYLTTKQKLLQNSAGAAAAGGGGVGNTDLATTPITLGMLSSSLWGQAVIRRNKTAGNVQVVL